MKQYVKKINVLDVWLALMCAKKTQLEIRNTLSEYNAVINENKCVDCGMCKRYVKIIFWLNICS